jgi:hypothetical protein
MSNKILPSGPPKRVGCSFIYANKIMPYIVALGSITLVSVGLQVK